MAEMLIQSESLTGLADKIRVLSGTEEAMDLDAMKNHIGEANDNVDTQAELIAQISAALEGKAGGGSENTGSSMQFATGTFTPTSFDICSNPITVSGLNFKPKSLIVVYRGDPNADKTYLSAKKCLMVIATGELFDNYSVVITNNSIYPSAVISAEFTNDGFILKSTDTTEGTMPWPHVYYVFG